MDFAGSADIFQAEMGNLMASLEYARAYIDDHFLRDTEHSIMWSEVVTFATSDGSFPLY